MLGCLAQLGRPLGDVDRMLVRAGQKASLIALHPMPACNHVGADHLIEGVQAGLVVGVGDGGRDVVAIDGAHGDRWYQEARQRWREWPPPRAGSWRQWGTPVIRIAAPA